MAACALLGSSQKSGSAAFLSSFSICRALSARSKTHLYFFDPFVEFGQLAP
jgi:hypothetical protein